MVQAGGGNTSIKTLDGKMLIKASGFTFSEMTETSGFVNLDLNKVSNLFNGIQGPDSEENEISYNKSLRSGMINVNSPRPSMETGMHIFLDHFVLHTHPVMTNIVTCMTNGEKIARELFSDISPEFMWVDYKNPGYQLAKEIKTRVSEYENKNGLGPEIIFLKNHGLIVSSNNSQKCLDMTFKINDKIFQHFKNFGIEKYPELKVHVKNGFCFSSNDVIKKFIENLNENKKFLSNYIIPDDVIYCSSGYVVQENPDKIESDKINIIKEGVIYPWNEKKSIKVDEVFTAKLYVSMIIAKIGSIDYIKSEDVEYIRNMDSEKYRQGLDKVGK